MNCRNSEAKIEEWLTHQIRELGGISYKFTSPGNPGVPDRIYILPGGIVWFVELKTEIGRLANIQKWQGKRIREHGCNYAVVKGMKEAQEFVRMVEEVMTHEIHTTCVSAVRHPEDA